MLKNKQISTLFGFCICGISLQVQADSPWYITVDAAAYFHENATAPVTYKNLNTVGSGNQNNFYSPGALAGAAVGYRLPEHFRVEVEATYINYQRDSIAPNVPAFPALNGSTFHHQSGGQLERIGGTVNLFYDIPVNNDITAYIGGGLGGFYGDTSQANYVNGRSVAHIGGSNYSDGAGLVDTGLRFAVNKNIGASFGYRYMQFFNENSPAHSIKLGVSYFF